MKARSTKGIELTQDLARFMANGGQYMVWTELPLGSVWFHSPGVVDILAVMKSWTTTNVKIYEVKISRSDYFNDVNNGKYEKYLACCTQFYFAAPSGMILKNELPYGCGLIVKTEDKGWRVVKAPNRREFQWNQDVLFKLLMRGFQDHFTQIRRLDRERYTENRDALDLARGKGAELAKKLRTAEAYINDADELKAKMEKELGKEYGDISIAMSRLRGEIETLLRQRKCAAEAIELAKITMDLFNGQYLATKYVAGRLVEIAGRLGEGES